MNHSTVEELIAMSTLSSPPHIESYHGLVRPVVSSGSSFIDVHRFDYSYVDQSHEVVTDTIQEKTQWLLQLINLMTNPIAKQGVNIILANMGHDANRDSTNQKTADDLLVLLAKHLIKKDASVISLVEEQLQDMVQLGQCAQGRTTRLWQLYQALRS